MRDREVNPVTRLYNDIVTILHTQTIKFGAKADEYETIDTKSNGDRYICALLKNDSFAMYDDYSEEEFRAVGIANPQEILQYQTDRFTIPIAYRAPLLNERRKRELSSYEEKNNYYRMLNGYPDLEDTDRFFLPEEIAKEYELPTDIPVHEIEDKKGDYAINMLMASGYLKTLQEEHPDKEYLQHIGEGRISIRYARQAKNFALLYVNQYDIMESTYREYIRSYEKARVYFLSTCYRYELRSVIPYYDNFIGLCIFVMAIQQVSMRAIENAVQREFYDEYMVELLYETYGVPYFSRIDKETQKLLVQNLNLLIQNKGTNKVIIDIASLLGFNDISIYQYYLVKQQLFDEEGLPKIYKKTVVDPATGKEKEVYDTERMFDIHFQKVELRTEDIKTDLLDEENRVEYRDVTYYDPYWWEDDELHTEIWDRQYNYVESKYLGATIPYRMTDVLFDSVILLKMIIGSKELYDDIEITLPRIVEEPVSLPDTIYLLLALMAKKLNMPGQIISTPSKLVHILETIGQEFNGEDKHVEALSFNFYAFSPEEIENTKSILEPYFKRKEYRIVNGHDVDLNEDGSQNTSGPTKLVARTINTEEFDQFMGYLSTISTASHASNVDRRNALNELYTNIRALYEFLSYEMSKTTDPDEYYALKLFYDTAFYADEIASAFSIETEDGVRPATTFEEYFLYTNSDLYTYLQNVNEDDIYAQIDHIIYKLTEVSTKFSSLYTLNDGSSPLMDLLETLIKFFKSYRLDFIDLSSIMVLDWEMENTIRFFGAPHYINKVDVVEDQVYTQFMDQLHKLIVRYSVEDRIALSEFLRTHATIRVNDEFTIDDPWEYLHEFKQNAINSEFAMTDRVSGLKGTIRVEEAFHLSDSCVKKQDRSQEEPYEQDQTGLR